MSPDVLTWLSKTGGTAGILILALWLFRDRIYFSFGQPPEGVQFKHPAAEETPDEPPALPRSRRRHASGTSKRSR